MKVLRFCERRLETGVWRSEDGVLSNLKINRDEGNHDRLRSRLYAVESILQLKNVRRSESQPASMILCAVQLYAVLQIHAVHSAQYIRGFHLE